MKQKQLIRTCLSCGVEKPLAAFLQITGTHGTQYGNICSSCRSKSARDKKPITLPDDDSSRGSTGLKIGAKERAFSDAQEKKEYKKSKEVHYKELEKRERFTLNKIEQNEKTQTQEKKHREFYLDKKQKESFLNTKTPSKPKTPIINTNAKKNIEDQNRLSTIDVSQLYLDSQFGELKFQSVVFRQFKEWLGEGANFRVMERIMKGKVDAKTKNSPDAKKAETFLEIEKKHRKPTTR